MSSESKGFMFGIKPHRVSLVKRPANKRKFLVTKSQEEEEMDFSEIVQIITKTEADNEDNLVEALKSAGKDEGAVQAAVSIFRTLSAYADSLGEDDLSAIGKALNFVEEAEEVVEEEVEKEEEEIEEEVEKADESEEVTEEVEEVEKAEDTEEVTEEDATEEVVKSITDSRIEELQEKIASLEGDRRREELRQMVRGLRVGKTEDELIDILFGVEKSGGEVSQIVETWKSASDSVTQALIEIGSELPGVISKDVYTEAEAEVERIARDEGVSIAKAWDLLADRNPAILKKYYKDN